MPELFFCFWTVSTKLKYFSTLSKQGKNAKTKPKMSLFKPEAPPLPRVTVELMTTAPPPPQPQFSTLIATLIRAWRHRTMCHVAGRRTLMTCSAVAIRTLKGKFAETKSPSESSGSDFNWFYKYLTAFNTTAPVAAALATEATAGRVMKQ